MHTTFIVVTHQSESALPACLDALDPLPDRDILVVDNASTDRTRALAAARNIRVIACAENTGFAAAANRGAREAAGPVLCFLNPDCVLTAEALAEARTALSAAPRNAAVPVFRQGGGELPGRQPGYTWRKVLADQLETNRRFPGWMRRLRAHPRHHDPAWHWPLGTVLFVGRELFHEAGGFDERYFLYMEDVAFGLALRRIGAGVLALEARVDHRGMEGSAVDPERRRDLLNRARAAYARREHGWLAGRLARTLGRP